MNSNSDSLPLVLWGFDILATMWPLEATQQPICVEEGRREEEGEGKERKGQD